MFLRRRERLRHEHVNDRLLKRCTDVGQHFLIQITGRLRQTPLGNLRQVSHGSFQSAEAEILGTKHAARKIKTLWIAAARVLFDFRAAGITEPEHLGHFVECFARSIVNRAADELVIRQAANEDQHRVSAAHDER